ncbi:outer membrane lipoprotein-sorting protein [Motiliproteus coralliicola]|uniref:Outer membrane lipoprotein-sorting protein n=1 Tax=Motiliproteus coralliicola TaxID=2283196 RepID=A0A369WM74_9GAMM|nr:outer membrane lipoprotein-sorting protein [Motiliproteus coralliicola]RDE22777.1 outer membrane lipoprotein-sorting protein [Motiliproteus coralliicola]
MLRLLPSLSLLLLPLISLPTQADDDPAVARGHEIVTEADNRDKGWINTESTMKMELSNAHGDVSVRQLRTKALEVEGDGDKGLTIFDQPLDVKGTAFLTFSHALEPDDQWIYLPALKRVKRISSRNKSGPFMGSEFAYEDMASFEVEKYDYRYLRDEMLDGIDCFVVESYPRDKNSGYTRLVTWFDKAEYRAQKINYFDRKNAALKTLRFSEFKHYLDQYWRPHRMHMVNHQTGKSTVLTFDEIRFQTGLSDRDFNKNSLKRAK